MIGRLQHLEKMGLAAPAGPGEWMVGLEAEKCLRDLGMRGDIITTMHRAFTEKVLDRGVSDYVIDTDAPASPIIGGWWTGACMTIGFSSFLVAVLGETGQPSCRR